MFSAINIWIWTITPQESECFVAFSEESQELPDAPHSARLSLSDQLAARLSFSEDAPHSSRVWGGEERAGTEEDEGGAPTAY